MESVKVVVRCRPMNQREKTLKCHGIVRTDCVNAQCTLLNPAEPDAPPKSFTFDGAYGDNSTTEQIYNDIVFSIVESVTEGYNGTVFAYGQTGCGKSFSMQGVCNPTTQRGIIPRSFEHIFEAIAAATDAKYLVNATYLEIYNEEIRDLLASDPKKKCDIKEHPETGVYIPGLSLHTVNSVAECESVMEQGWRNRSVGATLMNADSSRSHSIFTIHVEQMETGGGKHIRKGKLNLVDLAGSERQCKTGATGDRLKEATKINLSLSALGNVISALVDGKAKHIPYRDSKLTRLLQDSLGGNTKTLMVACLSPADNNYDETLSTLRYANRAKNIKNKPKVNEDPKDALLREYKEELERLKKLLVDQVSANPPPPSAPLQSRENLPNPTQNQNDINDFVDSNKVEDEKVTLQIEDLRQQFEQEKRAKDKLMEDMNQLKEFYERKLQAQKDDPDGPGGVRDSPEIKHLIQDATNVKIEDEPALMEQMQTTALQRLQELQSKIVGGEKADDQELKRKREKRKNYAEKRIRAMAEVLARIDGTDEGMPDYEDMNAQLENKTAALKRAKKKLQSLETEIKDLQEEFERERTDYLDTIRRQEKALKLQARILDKVQGVIRRDCNYTNLEQIRSQARWDEDLQNWILPEVNLENMKLPLANGNTNSFNASSKNTANIVGDDNKMNHSTKGSHGGGGRKGGSPTGSLNGTLTNGWLDGFNSSLSGQAHHKNKGHLFFGNNINTSPHDSNNNQVISSSMAQDRVKRMNLLNAEQLLNDDSPTVPTNGENVSSTACAQGLFGAAVVATRSRSLPNKKNGSGTISPEGGFFVRRPARLESLGVNGEELALADPPPPPRGRRRSRTYEDLLDAWPSV